ncbi:MAG: hypothetical protein V7784_11195 [Oceanospirillaceae bacterium]
MLEKLKEYKELISIILFFLAGFSWFNNQFPTKNDLSNEIKVVNCLLQNYMELTQLQIEYQNNLPLLDTLTKEINRLKSDSLSLELSPPLRSQLIFNLDQSENNFSHLVGKQRNIITSIEEIMKRLASHVCKKE